MCAQSSAIVHICGLLGHKCKGNFRHKMTRIVGNRGYFWTSMLSPSLLSPHLPEVTSTPDPKSYEKYRGTPPISIAIVLQKYALFLPESLIVIYTTSLCHDMAPLCIPIFLQKYEDQGAFEQPPNKMITKPNSIICVKCSTCKPNV